MPSLMAPRPLASSSSYSNSFRPTSDVSGLYLEGSAAPQKCRFEPPSFSSPPPKERTTKEKAPKHRYHQRQEQHEQQRTTPWLHREGTVNGVRLHWVEAHPHPTNNVATTGKPRSACSSNGNDCSANHMQQGSNNNSSTSVVDMVVLLHGFAEFWYSWRGQINALAGAGYRVVVPDLRGYNFSEKCEDGYDLNTLSDDVAALIIRVVNDQFRTNVISSSSSSSSSAHNDPLADRSRQRTRKLHKNPSSSGSDRTNRQNETSSSFTSNKRLPRVYLVGHDLGATIAAATAARHPEFVHKLVMVNGALAGQMSGDDEEQNNLLSWQQRLSFMSSAAAFRCPLVPELVLGCNRAWLLSKMMFQKLILGAAQQPKQPKKEDDNKIETEGNSAIFPFDESTCEMYRDAISQPGALHCMLEYYRQGTVSGKQAAAYPALQCPVLVLWGRDDPWLDVEIAEGIQLVCRGNSGSSSVASTPKARNKDNPAPASSSSSDQEDEEEEQQVKTIYFDCGHWPTQECPEQVNESLLCYFRESSKSSKP